MDIKVGKYTLTSRTGTKRLQSHFIIAPCQRWGQVRKARGSGYFPPPSHAMVARGIAIASRIARRITGISITKNPLTYCKEVAGVDAKILPPPHSHIIQRIWRQKVWLSQILGGRIATCQNVRPNNKYLRRAIACVCGLEQSALRHTRKPQQSKIVLCEFYITSRVGQGLAVYLSDFSLLLLSPFLSWLHLHLLEL
jgi:hypothetical protein